MRSGAEQPEHGAGRAAHHKDQRAGDGKKHIHRSGDGQRHLFGPLQCQRLRHQLAQNHVQTRDQTESDADRDAVGVDQRRAGHVAELEALHDLRQQGLTDPAQGQADHGDAQLDAVDDFVQIAVQTLHNAGADPAGLDELLDASIADADQRELRGRKESVGRHQKQDQKTRSSTKAIMNG